MDAAARQLMLRTMAVSESLWYREVQQLVNYLEQVEGERNDARAALTDCQAKLAKVEEERWRLAMPKAASVASKA